MNRMRQAVQADAWRGTASAVSAFAEDADRWAVMPVERAVNPQAPVPTRPDDWDQDTVGWGIIVPDTDQGTVSDRAAGRDLPPIVQQLVSRRRGTVLRHRAAPRGGLPTHVWRYHPRRSEAYSLPIGGSRRGRGLDAVPVFLMLLGGPDQLPWKLQYALNLDPRTHPGRLPLTGAPLERYVARLLGGWEGDADSPSSGRAVVWSADHGADDITRLLRLAVAAPVLSKYVQDTDVDVTSLAGTAATTSALATALTDNKPGVVLTTSHGYTGPAGGPDPDLLGLPVDTNHDILDPTSLLETWQPDGAVWYAHACCGAGCDSPSSFAGLFEAGGPLDRMMEELAGIGPAVAPLPVALLGAERPARAFIAHVEPTYDWTLQDEATGRAVLADLTDALYGPLLLGSAVGSAVSPYPVGAGSIAGHLLDTTRRAVLEDDGDPLDALRERISYLDRRSLVVLGDPAVALPSLAAPTSQGLQRSGTPMNPLSG